MSRIRSLAGIVIVASLALGVSCGKSPGPGQAAASPTGATVAQARPAAGGASGSAKGAAAIATPVAASQVPRPWYAERFEQLGFYVFPAPVDAGDFSIESLNGGSVTLSESKGKVVMLNFWATWCPPCRAEMPSIEILSKKMKGKAFAIMAISVGETKDTVAKFIALQKYSYPIYLDPDSKLGTAFNASSIPTTYIFGKDGKAIAGIQGSRQYDTPEVLALLEELIAK
ncbi:MAG: TlpA disulfide reductase family protein [Spirochaetota bacterium]